MSRCFPFPPPGYEKEARRGDDGELLKKEKHKEKKHKKEKRDREKKEGKERTDKDRSKDKHKERKERKDKHKDKTRDKDKNRTHEDTRTEVRPEPCDADQLGYNCKAEEVKDSKFTEELGRRIRDDERGAAIQSVGKFTDATQRRLEAVGVSIAVEKDTENKMVANLIGTAQRRNENLARPVQKRAEGIGTGFATANQRATSMEKVDFASTVPGKNHVTSRQVNQFTGPFQSRTENALAANSLQKKNVASNSITGHVSNFMGSGQRRIEGMLTSNPIQKEIAGKNDVSGQPVDSFIGSVQKSTFTANSMQKERGASNNMASNFVGAAQRKNGELGQQLQNISSSILRNTEGIRFQIKDGGISLQKERAPSNDTDSNSVGAALGQTDRIGQQVRDISPSFQRTAEGIGLAPKMEKDAVKTIQMVSNNIGSEHKTNDRMGQPVENSSDRKEERKEKKKEKKHKDRDRDERKSKRKDKDRHKQEEKEEKTRDKSDNKKHKGNGEPEEIKKDHVDNVSKSVAPPAENADTIAADGNSKKRKLTEINGFLHESDERHHKLPRTSALSSHSTLENGKSLKRSLIPSPCSIKLDTLTKPKAEIVSDKKETMRNGKTEAHPSSVVSRPPVAVDPVEGEKISAKISSRPPEIVSDKKATMRNGKAEAQPSPVVSRPLVAVDLVESGKFSSKISLRPPEIVSDKKETMRNGKADAHPSSVVSRPPVSVDPVESGKISSKISSRPPHPDAKYLETVYSVPQMSEWPESDDQDWLFDSKNEPKPLKQLEDNDAVPPQVWAKGLQIESADVFALPYVIPY